MRSLRYVGIGVVLAMTACGGHELDPEGERQNLAMLGGKADVPEWLRHIPEDFHCDSKLSGRFRGWDSAHLYSFPGKFGYEYLFRFDAAFNKSRGAAIAVYDAETGERVAIARNFPGTSAEVTYKAARSVKYLVAVYSVRWVATGNYTLSAECKRLELTCTSDLNCEAGQYCAQRACGSDATVPGTCVVQPDFCTEQYQPVCGCDGRNYGNACAAGQHRISVAHLGECLTIAVDPSTVDAGAPTTATLSNTLGESVFLGGCSPYGIERLEDGSWVEQGPTRICVWEGNAAEISAGKSYSEELNLKAGTYRVVGGYALGCESGKPLSQAKCGLALKAASKPFTVKEDSCWGAWIDNNGTCRTPADGVYPAACCDDSRQEFCGAINTRYVDALKGAKACVPVAGTAQCAQQVATDLACALCVEYVNSTTELEKISAEWKRVGCDAVRFICPAYMCPMPQGVTCSPINGDGGQGVCETNR